MELKTLKDLDGEHYGNGHYEEAFKVAKEELGIKWIKRIRLAQDWRNHQLSGNSGNAMRRQKLPKPKEFMDEKEINFLMQFCDTVTADTEDLLKYIFNVIDEDLK